MSKKIYWQDWVLIGCLLLGVVACLFTTGCEAAEPTLAPPRVLIFHAHWCKYCPTEQQITKLIVDFPDVEICPVDVDRDLETTQKYRIQRVPTFILCDDQGCRITHNLEELRCWLVERPSL